MPNKKVLKKKQQIVEQLAERLNGAVAGVLVEYRGISVEQDTKLRRQFREAGVEYNVVKNTMMRFAINNTELLELDPVLNGPTALATSTSDLVAPAKVIAQFAKENDKLVVKSGFLEGKVISVSEVNRLASLPSKEQLIAQVLGGLNAPIAGFANVLNANITGLVRVLDAIAKKSDLVNAE